MSIFRRPRELGYRKYGLPKSHQEDIYGLTKSAKPERSQTVRRETEVVLGYEAHFTAERSWAEHRMTGDVINFVRRGGKLEIGGEVQPPESVGKVPSKG